jgi:hypothetical protein
MMETSTQAWTDTEKMKEKASADLREGGRKIKAMTEQAAGKTPTLLFVGAALASIAVSLILQLTGKRQWSLFVGHWAPSFLLFGLLNKMSKTAGAD